MQINVFNISSNFIDNLFLWLQCKENLSDYTILLPNQQSANSLKQKFLQSNIVLPKIKKINDLEITDLRDLLPQNNHIDTCLQELWQIEVLGKIPSIFWLNNLIKNKCKFLHTNFSITLDFFSNFCDLENEQIKIDTINNIDDSDIADHRKISLDFIKKFYSTTKYQANKQNKMLAGSFYNLLCSTFCDLLDQYQLAKPLIIAGSSGSISATRQLIISTAKQQKGTFFAHGFIRVDNPKPTHPQYLLHQIIHKNTHITNIGDRSAKQEMLQNLFSDSSTDIDIDTNDFEIAECVNYYAEADFIRNKIKANPNKHIGIIVNNNDFHQILLAELNGFAIDNAVATNAGKHPFFVLLFLLHDLKNSKNCNAFTLLAILKHQLLTNFISREIIEQIEIKLLRQHLPAGDLKTFIDFFATKNNKELLELLPPLRQLQQSLPTTNDLIDFVKTIELLSKQSIDVLLDGNVEMLEFIFTAKQYQVNSDLEVLINTLSYFQGSKNNQATIKIVSRLEARLQNFDLLLVTNVNEGSFPEIQDGGMIGNKIKTELGINLNKKKFGQAAFDFCCYFQQKVCFSYSLKNKKENLKKSPFLLKLQILLKKSLHSNYKPAQIDLPYLPWQKPSVNCQFSEKQISQTDLYLLYKNPYAFYFKKILKLSSLQDIDPQYTELDIGKIVHSLLEKLPDKSQEIAVQDFIVNKDWHFFYQFSLKKTIDNFININQKLNKQYQFAKNICEDSVEFIFLDLIKVKCKIDRIAKSVNEIMVFDYKYAKNKSQDDFQLRIYDLALQSKQMKPTGCCFWFLKEENIDKAIINKIKDDNSKNSDKKNKNYDDICNTLSEFLQTDFPQFNCSTDIENYQDHFTRKEEWYGKSEYQEE